MNSRKREFSQSDASSIKDYIQIIRQNLFPIILITLTSLIFAVIFAVNSVNIYRSITSLKISKPEGSILKSSLMPEFSDFGSDRFIANEIQILKSYSIKERVAHALIDTFAQLNIPDSFSVILDKGLSKKTEKPVLLGVNEVVKSLDGIVAISQIRGLDIVEISVDSPSPFEAKLIANSYAHEYRMFNLEIARNQLTIVKEFLAQQRTEKLGELNQSEDLLKVFQESGGVVALDEQASNLITQLSDFEAKLNMAKIEMKAAELSLNKLRQELKDRDPKISAYIDGFASENYIKTYQEEIGKLELNRDVALANRESNGTSNAVINQYNKKIDDLKKKLDEKIEIFKRGAFSTSPDEVKELSMQVIEHEVKYQGARTSVEKLQEFVGTYENQFNKLPKSMIEFGRLKRSREALEKLYLLVEEKYQEALINEQSQPGNVLVIDQARRPFTPAKPNRMLIVLTGFVLGLGIALTYAFLRNYFDNTVKTPEDLQQRNVNVLTWIPMIEHVEHSGQEFEFIVAKKPDSIPSEAFRALRTRVQFAKVDKENMKVILVTSSAPSEGKTTICTNLAGSFAQSNKRVLVIDCDLRKPRIHSFFKVNRYPGLVDHLFDQVAIEDIIRSTEIPNLSFITAGTIPPNPAELLESERFSEFLKQIQADYDYVLLDSPPIVAVTDSEILSRIADATMLVVSANTTEFELMDRAVDILRQNDTNFIGTVLNNFVYKASYGSYYKYYYYYSRPAKANADKPKLPTKKV